MVPESNPSAGSLKGFLQWVFLLSIVKPSLKRRALNKSILDFALESAKGFNNRLSKMDQDKLDEYFSSVRELEKRIEREEKKMGSNIHLHRPEGIPDNYKEHLRIMFDMMASSFSE